MAVFDRSYCAARGVTLRMDKMDVDDETAGAVLTFCNSHLPRPNEPVLALASAAIFIFWGANSVLGETVEEQDLLHVLKRLESAPGSLDPDLWRKKRG